MPHDIHKLPLAVAVAYSVAGKDARLVCEAKRGKDRYYITASDDCDEKKLRQAGFRVHVNTFDCTSSCWMLVIDIAT